MDAVITVDPFEMHAVVATVRVVISYGVFARFSLVNTVSTVVAAFLSRGATSLNAVAPDYTFIEGGVAVA